MENFLENNRYLYLIAFKATKSYSSYQYSIVDPEIISADRSEVDDALVQLTIIDILDCGSNAS